MFGLSELEEQIRKLFRLEASVIVPGDSENSGIRSRSLDRAGCSVLRKAMGKNDVIAVTGGSTLAQVANQLTSQTPLKRQLVRPGARRTRRKSGLPGEHDCFHDGQANRRAVPDAACAGSFGRGSVSILMQEPNIREIVEVIRRARIVVHGIGDAMVMARRRRVDAAVMEAMKAEGALAEAFGYYFDRQGDVVHKMPTAGLRLEDIIETEVVIGIAGGQKQRRSDRGRDAVRA